MILTLTPNPSLDRTIELSAPLVHGAVQRSLRTTDEPGGKGVNVSRGLAASGADTVAILPGALDDPMLVALRARGVPTVNLPIDGHVRQNITITDPDGTTTKINEPGPDLSTQAVALVDLVVEHAASTEWLVIAGSLPPGLPDDFLAGVVHSVRLAFGADAPRIAVDSSGTPFRALIESGVGVDLVKPNAEELAEIVGGDPAVYETDRDAAVAGARILLSRGVGAVLLTLGSAGAVLVDGTGAWFAAAPTIVALSTVGAGDSSLAGYLLAETAGASPAARLAQAVASGAAAASLPGSLVPTLGQTFPDVIDVVSLSQASATRA
ncbi:1-phosphofructokinase family hexose kinase [Frondihabitans sp. VKM Ac-2883]|uniref:1-phosphofructokinase family hexose kinase n=1 Tax=Frondihabitans sp. VKM Ac-2883 TaxID=2783823 RepID=UPI00188CC203|nr:1-phosphofructokinase family hexose kinase [Frondihabitans sp. VKM Ac-2883]MBF4576195.1 1-phosphofructokinase family hexose kinase [Frondihabitans sp. VKM Ac-2883]